MRRSSPRLAPLLSLLVGAVGCESRATPEGSGAAPEAEPRIENLARQTSRLGEYHAAAAATATTRGDHAAAAESYAEAAEAFRKDGVTLPARIACHHGVALRRSAAGDRGKAEEAARLLHVCVLGTPSGTEPVKVALQELSALEPLGFDPAVLTRDRPAERYLTLPPRLPTAEQLALEVVGMPTKGASRLETAWLGVLTGPELPPMLLPCLETYWNATQKDDVTFPLAVKWKARWSVDVGDWVGGVFELTLGEGLEGPRLVAGECVKTALEPALADLGKKGTGVSWQEELTLTLRANR